MTSPLQLEIRSTCARTRSHGDYPYPLPEADLLVLEDTYRRRAADVGATISRANVQWSSAAGILRLLRRMLRAPRIRSRVATMSVVCICLAPVLAPCGDAEPSFDDQVRHHLVRSGYLSPLDILRPFDAQVASDRCRLARAPRNCSCVSQADRIAAASVE